MTVLALGFVTNPEDRGHSRTKGLTLFRPTPGRSGFSGGIVCNGGGGGYIGCNGGASRCILSCVESASSFQDFWPSCRVSRISGNSGIHYFVPPRAFLILRRYRLQWRCFNVHSSFMQQHSQVQMGQRQAARSASFCPCKKKNSVN